MDKNDFSSLDKNNSLTNNTLIPIKQEVIDKVSGKKVLKWAFANASGRIAFPQLFDMAEPFNEYGLAMVRLDQEKIERFGFIDKTGKVVISVNYELIYPFNNYGFANIKKNNCWGYINIKGEEIIPPIYSLTEFFEDNLIKVYSKFKWGFINHRNEVVVPLVYDWIWNFREGIAIARIGELYGAVNLQGQEVIPLKFHFMKPFHEGLSATKLIGKWGYINSNGSVQISFEFDDAGNFESQKAQVMLGVEFFFIDTLGKDFVMK